MIKKFFRKALENKRLKRYLGVGLTVILMFSGAISNITAANEGLNPDETLLGVPDSQLLTEVTLTKPLQGVIGQDFHAGHQAIDILAPMGTEIRAITSGRVIEKGFSPFGYGNTVVVEHDKSLTSRYAHLKEIRVTVGQDVNKDSVIGTVGMTGWTTGPHLHLEIYQNGHTLNPQSVLPEYPLNLALGK